MALAQTYVPIVDINKTNLLNAEENVRLSKKLQAYRVASTKKVEIVYHILPNLIGKKSLEDEAAKIMKKTGYSNKNGKKGLLVLLTVLEHKALILPGYGLDSLLNKAYCDEIARAILEPAFTDYKWSEALILATDLMIAKLQGESVDFPQRTFNPNTQRFPPKPYQYRAVSDYANFLTDIQEQEIGQTLKNYFDTTAARTQIVVLTVESLGDMKIEDYAQQIFQEWGIGQKGANNGLLLLFAKQERKMRIHTGYGMENYLPDRYCADLIDYQLVPKFKEARYAEGISIAIELIIARLRGEKAEFDGLGGPKQTIRGSYFLLSNIFLIIPSLLCFLFAIFQVESKYARDVKKYRLSAWLKLFGYSLTRSLPISALIALLIYFGFWFDLSIYWIIVLVVYFITNVILCSTIVDKIHDWAIDKDAVAEFWRKGGYTSSYTSSSTTGNNTNTYSDSHTSSYSDNFGGGSSYSDNFGGGSSGGGGASGSW